MKLYVAGPSPFARKVLVTAHELGLFEGVEQVQLSPWGDDGTFRAINPLCQIPTLVADDGAAIYDSAVICAYLLDKAGAPALRWPDMQLEALADGAAAAGVRRIREMLRPEAERHLDVIDRQNAAMIAAFDVLEGKTDRLAGGFGVGQIAVAALLGYSDFRFGDLAWRQGRPKLAAWFASVEGRPSMQATVPQPFKG